MELLEVAPDQRVSLEKQQITNSIPRADKPNIRRKKIHSLLEALNLHNSGSMNQFLKAFGVKVAYQPKRVEGIRRAPPDIVFGRQFTPNIDKEKYNWRQFPDTKYVDSARVERILIAHSDETGRLLKELRAALERMFRNRGILCNKFESVCIRRGKEEMESQLEEVFRKNKGSKSLLIIYIDSAESKSHDFLKLMERKYLIRTQQITAELAERIKGKNRWIANGKTLVVGYDVAHPGKPTRDE
ncbi:unnamed protein product, partial [Strongylus vulgaris]